MAEEEVVEDEFVVEEEQSNEEVEETEVEDSDEVEDDEEEEDRIVTIGDEEPPEEEEEAEAPGWVKKVRKVNRKLESEVKALKRQLAERSTEQQKPEPTIEVGEKPTLKSVRYDDKKYEQELASYYERKRLAEEQQAQQAKQVEEQKRQWQKRQERYVEKKREHSFKDFDEVEDLVQNSLDVMQQNIIIHGADDSSLLVYALGRNPKKLEELSAVRDPVEFAFRVAKLEEKLKVTSKKAPAPEKKISGSKAGGLSGKADQTLERLRKEAERTNDYTKVTAYKRKQRDKRDN